ncbi:hypothetical protein QE390_003482 [Siphonobacter sp. SORGH_AS 1065]|nr:hypothetical protein [Siphonobacter sp. SORGH_AS_1065]
MQLRRTFLHILGKLIAVTVNARFLFLLFLLTQPVFSFAQGVKGIVKNKSGEVLPFASIQVKGTQTGTITNEEGRYEIKLQPGTYELQFQYLNHQTEVRQVEVKEGFLTLDVALEQVAVRLAEIRVGKSKEDPAYTIMRKAIATARYHQLEVDTWSARTYVKGNFRIEKVPFLFEDALKKSNLQVGTMYVLESINDIEFRQPNQVTEKVRSIRSNLPPGANPSINFARLSFYNPNLGDIVSPLSPRSFGYYKFEYLGFFTDRGLTVNRIKVTPRSKGINVLDGTINLIEGSWSIHSLSFTFQDENGIQYSIRQLFSPFENVWMPVQLETNAKISIFGAKGETRYVTSVRNYQLKVNPKYHQVPEVVDEKIDKELAASLRKPADIKTVPAQATRKQLRKMVDQMEKEERKERKKQGEDVTITRNWSFQVDSLARKQPSTFWEGERQVPLTALETQGYQRADSLYKANEAKIRKDSIRNLPAFKLGHLIAGHTYNYGQRKEGEWYRQSLTFESPIMNLTKFDFFNSVEGYVLKTRLAYTERLSRTARWHIALDGRYSFARNRLNGGLTTGFSKERTIVTLQAGRNVFQFNPANPIPENLNTYYTLFRERNLIKLYEKAYVEGHVTQQLGNRLRASFSMALEDRYLLQNRVSKGWINRPEVEFTPNNPDDVKFPNQANFGSNRAAIVRAGLSYRPFAKAAIVNGRRYVINNRSPEFTGNYTLGVAGSRVFSSVELGARDEVTLFRNSFSYAVQAGGFIKGPTYFMDFKHFNGNETIFQSPGLMNFRMLPYYSYSTASGYLQAHGSYNFRKFLLTQITPVRLYGIRENVFVNYLKTNNVGHLEVGYGFEGILKVLGAEVISNFQSNRFQGMGFRIRSAF